MHFCDAKEKWLKAWENEKEDPSVKADINLVTAGRERNSITVNVIAEQFSIFLSVMDWNYVVFKSLISGGALKHSRASFSFYTWGGTKANVF